MSQSTEVQKFKEDLYKTIDEYFKEDLDVAVKIIESLDKHIKYMERAEEFLKGNKVPVSDRLDLLIMNATIIMYAVGGLAIRLFNSIKREKEIARFLIDMDMLIYDKALPVFGDRLGEIIGKRLASFAEEIEQLKGQKEVSVPEHIEKELQLWFKEREESKRASKKIGIA